jgi:hypothetical protein
VRSVFARLRVQVDVAPPQTADLTPAEAGERELPRDCVPVAVVESDRPANKRTIQANSRPTAVSA